MSSVPSFAEVQNVKVGGDITVRGFWRRNLDLRHAESTATPGRQDDLFLMSTTGVNVGADLTENVGAFIRLANERDWNQDEAGTSTANTAAGDFDLSQAYITLKELFYSPLTVRVGQQPIVWGRGFILGSNLLPSILNTGGGTSTAAGDDRNAAISANEYTDFTAFDAIRATLDLGGVASIGVPLMVDYVYIKQDEGLFNEADDINVQGLNFSTHFDSMNSEVEAYYLNKRDRSRTITQNRGSVSTIGLRGSAKPVEGAYLYSEMALQFGKKGTLLDAGITTNPTGSGQQAWAFDLGGEFTFADVATSPKVGLEWIFYSGHDKDGAFQGWDPIAPSYFTTLIRSYQTRNTGVTGLYPTDQAGVTSAFTNQHEFALYGGLKPIDDLGVDSRLSWFWLEDGSIPTTTPAGSASRNSYLGTEWDTMLTYDYTDDVQFGLAYGVFFPGNVFRDAGDGSDATSGADTAQQLISKVSVKF
ncbi:MAG: alginate export family protein [Candidatus Omnitrophica bacterium]|nr:alginate export family protein [Candidatus Omnitrophota bacterium]